MYAVAFCHGHNNLLILLNNKCNYVPGTSANPFVAPRWHKGDAVRPEGPKGRTTSKLI